MWEAHASAYRTGHLTAGSVAEDMIANGQVLQISTNPALFALLGSKFGGDGTTTFALPNPQASAPNGLTYWVCSTALRGG